MSLCFRCEHRARYLTDKLNHKKHCHQPRFECGEPATSKYSCYMFIPCMPIVTSSNDDVRPRFAGAMLSARERVVRIMDRDEVEATIIYENNGEVALGWKVKDGT